MNDEIIYRCADVKDGKVINVALANLDTAAAFGWVIIPDDLEPKPGIGWTYDGETFGSPSSE